MTEDMCKHAFHVKENDCWYCDEAMLPVDEGCKMACFTPKNSKVDNAKIVRDMVENSFMNNDD